MTQVWPIRTFHSLVTVIGSGLPCDPKGRETQSLDFCGTNWVKGNSLPTKRVQAGRLWTWSCWGPSLVSLKARAHGNDASTRENGARWTQITDIICAPHCSCVQNDTCFCSSSYKMQQNPLCCLSHLRLGFYHL